MKLFHADITFRWFRSVFSFVLLLLAAVELVIVLLAFWGYRRLRKKNEQQSETDQKMEH